MGNREKNRGRRKGFTIVELVIVIAVIGILTAILIPTFVNLTAKAQAASDQSFVKNANTALAMDGKHDSMREAIAAVQEQAGLDVASYKPGNGNHLIYDPAADRFALVDDDAHLVFGDGELKVTRPGEMLEVTDTFDVDHQKFGIYAGPEWDLAQTVIGTLEHPLTVSFDAGEQDNIVSIYFKRASDAPAYGHGLIATGDNMECELTIDAPADTIHHAGMTDNIHVIAVANSSYHEHGYSFQPIIIDAGHFVLESGSDVVVEPSSTAVTVTSTGSNSSTVNYPASALEPAKVTELRLPSFITKFKNRVATLDKVETIQTNKNPNRNTFYENEEGTYDVYKVGDDNPLAFPLMAVTTDPLTLAERVFKNPTGLTWAAKDQDETIYNSGSGTDVINYVDGNLILGAGAIAKTFHFTATLNGKSVSFDFKGVDGYNVVDAKGLSLFDNTSYRNPDHDFWHDFKVANHIPLDIHPNGLVLHNDITLKSTDFPGMYFYTADEVKAYFNTHSEEMDRFLQVKNELRKEYGLPKMTKNDAMRLLSGSLKDDYNLYYRATSEIVPATVSTTEEGSVQANNAILANADDFTLEGNYFTLDASHIKLVFFFGTRYKGISYEKGTLSTPVSDGSHSALFGFNSSYHTGLQSETTHEDLYPRRGIGGTNEIRNINFIGNGERSNDDNYMGSLMMFKIDATEVSFTNIIAAKTFTTFMSQIGDNRFVTGDTSTVRTPNPVMVIDRCKSFDSYNSMLYIYGTNHNYITNSFMKGAGGAIMLLDERNKHQKGTSAYDPHFEGYDTTVDCANVYFENYVASTDAWFAHQEGAPALINGLGMFGLAASAMFRNGGFAKVTDSGDTLVNLIALDMCASQLALPTSLEGHVKIWDSTDFEIPSSVPTTIADTQQFVDLGEGHLRAALDMPSFDYATYADKLMVFQAGTDVVSYSGGTDPTVHAWGDTALGLPVADYVSCYLNVGLQMSYPGLYPMGILLGQA